MINNNDKRIKDFILLLKIPKGRRKALLRKLSTVAGSSPALPFESQEGQPTTEATRQVLIYVQEALLSA
jgi:hypothetical protein